MVHIKAIVSQSTKEFHMPDDNTPAKGTLDEAVLAVISAGYTVLHPGQTVPASWFDQVKNVMRIATLVIAAIVAIQQQVRPPATPEQVQAVKDVVPTAEQVADKVWAPTPVK